ncbi:3-oxo-tetronate kinase [Rhizobium sp. GR12]|uniref:3-oxo-tetronate kinase n=1 Tax=Rhizobium sp. GR12 TaxID=3053925 RepID=UPI002FBDFB47
MLLGAIADDLTGATDIALAFAREGLRTVQINGIPDDGAFEQNADAVVIALKSRTIPASDAVSLSRRAVAWLRARDVQQVVFKYCSTFDSTDAGNIGPVTEALLEELGETITIACPTFPENGRTVFQGHLFVGDKLLSESSMRDHPLTPMTDANLVRVLQRQTALPVGILGAADVRAGQERVAARIREAATQNVRVLIADAATAEDLNAIGKACSDRMLVTGAAGIGGALARNHAAAIQGERRSAEFAWPQGRTVVLAGSCSVATRDQVNHVIGLGYPATKIDPIAIASGTLDVASVAEWAEASEGWPPIIYSSSDPADVLKAQEVLGRDEAGALVEDFLGELAGILRSAGFSRFIVAGGETSGAVSAALSVSALEIGPEIDPGVPWTRAAYAGGPALALKSGNFGAPDFFEKARRMCR